jgi:predicted O-methyltransferase YrrM
VEDFGAGGPADTLTTSAQQTGRTVAEVVGDSCRNYSKPPQWAALLFHLVRQFQPGTCIELGTCLGISAAYEGAALALNGRGRLVTMEGCKAFAAIAAETVAGLGLSPQVSIVAGPFHHTLGRTLGELGRVDYAFIDGHHDEEATVRYFEQLLPSLGERAVLVFDDIQWSPGMRRAWATVCRHPRVAVAVDLRTVGVCLTGVGAKLRRTVVME